MESGRGGKRRWVWELLKKTGGGVEGQEQAWGRGRVDGKLRPASHQPASPHPLGTQVSPWSVSQVSCTLVASTRTASRSAGRPGGGASQPQHPLGDDPKAWPEASPKAPREAELLPPQGYSLVQKAILQITISSQWVKIHGAWNHLHSYIGRNFESTLLPSTLPGSDEELGKQKFIINSKSSSSESAQGGGECSTTGIVLKDMAQS